jgi:dipeptidyl aminopeptidase/acylaminoacyl peptidase
MSVDGRHIAYVVGDTLWVTGPTGRDRRRVATGMLTSAGTVRPFLAFSPGGDRLVFRLGEAGGERAMIAWLGDTIRLEPLFPDSLDARHMLFQHFAAGGPSWSPDGRAFAFLAADRSREEPLQLFIRDMASGELRRLTSTNSMHYSVAWSPDGRTLAYTRADSSRVVLVLRSAEGEESRVVDAFPALWATDLLWSPDGSRVALYTDQGRTLVYSIATGGGVTDIPRHFLGWSGNETLVGARRTGMSTEMITYSIADSAVQPLTTGDVYYDPIAVGHAGDTTRVMYAAETGDIPRDLWVTPLVHDPLPERITDANPGLRGQLPGRSRIVRWQVNGGRLLEAQVVIPSGRGPFPLVVVPYGGRMNAFPSADYFLDLGIYPLVARGYAVAFPNTRGPASEAAVAGEYGSLQLGDTEALLDTLIAEGLVRGGRVALLGHSHGGSLVYFYATHSSRFCAAVAVNGRADWEQQAQQGDRYLVRNMGGSPAEIPALYQERSPLRRVARTTVPLLAVTGMLDSQIYPFNGRRFTEALVAAGGRGALLEFPEEGHMIAAPGNRTLLWERIFGWFGEHCR